MYTLKLCSLSLPLHTFRKGIGCDDVSPLTFDFRAVASKMINTYMYIRSCVAKW